MIPGHASRLSYILGALCATALFACSASNDHGSSSGEGGAGNAAGTSDTTGTMTGTPIGSAGGDTGGLEAPDGGSGGGSSGGQTCSAESQFVYTVDDGNRLYKFDPPSRTFTLIGKLDCPAQSSATPFSMAVDRDANAWVLYNDGSLFQVSTQTAACKSTTFAKSQSGFTKFGMGFAANAPGSSEETLYVTNAATSGTTIGLAKIDLQTLKLTPIGKYDKLNAGAELTGTGDARLFGAFQGQPYVVAEIDKTTAKILSIAPQTGVQTTSGSFNFAFAFWGGSFWLFVGPGDSTGVFEYNPITKTTKQVSSESFAIVGAGVSTCAPLKPPA